MRSMRFALAALFALGVTALLAIGSPTPSDTAAAASYNCVDLVKADSYWGPRYDDANLTCTEKAGYFDTCPDRSKYSINQVPEVGAIIVERPGVNGSNPEFGHVGIVVEITPGEESVTVYEQGPAAPHTSLHPIVSGVFFIHKEGFARSSSDFNGDGCPDIVGRRASDASLRLYEGNCKGGWKKTNVQIGTGWGGFDWLLGPGDFSGDGCPDIVGRRASDASLRLYEGNCKGDWKKTNVQIGTGWSGFDWLL
ncbi:MAG: hypothetical protein A2Y74_01795 [Actinobacteria bacterium RBG_13_63_9]|nr:MAG: hypothetical protein A2Y74_01795 [Actinobacteria bacterium RBG_13_63_9]